MTLCQLNYAVTALEGILLQKIRVEVYVRWLNEPRRKAVFISESPCKEGGGTNNPRSEIQ
jgi:hypothetical protein